MRSRVFAVGLLFVSLIIGGRAQPMLLDDSFNPRILKLGGGVTAMALDSDGKILVGGIFQCIGGLHRQGFARLHPDGTADTTFNPPPVSAIAAITTLADGAILVGGAFQSVSGLQRVALVRFTSTGQPDFTFDARINAGGSVRAIALQPDGKILLAGSFTHVHALPRRSLARLHADGAVDASFDPGVGPDGFVNSLIVGRHGKILVTGAFTNFNLIHTPFVARLQPDGSIDPAFSTQSRPDSWVYSVQEADDGKLWIGGSFNHVGDQRRDYLARLNDDGTLDTTLVPAPLIGSVNTLILQEQSLIVGGWSYILNSPGYTSLARLNEDGSIDPGFAAGTVADSLSALSATSDGDLLIANDFSVRVGPATNILVRLRSDGQRQTNFQSDVGRAGEIQSMVVGVDRRITFLGTFSHVNGVARNGVARIRGDGSLDTSFDPMSQFASYSSAEALCLAPDGGYLMVGDFRQEKTWRQVVHVLADGSVRPIPTPDYRLYWETQVRQDADGRIIVAGAKYHNSQTRPIQRFAGDGTVDASFYPVFAPLALPRINDLIIESDGKITIAGEFDVINAIPRFCVARLHPDGSVDATFDPGNGANQEVRAIVRQMDGRYVLGGKFAAYDGVNRNGIARILNSGELDITFGSDDPPASGFYYGVHCLALQDDGKIFAGGDFTWFNDTPRNRIARLNTDGTLDHSFDPGLGANEKVSVLKITSDGDLLIAGAFSEVAGKPHFALARYFRLPRFATAGLTDGCRRMRVLAPEGETVLIETSKDLSRWTPLWTNTATSGSVEFTACEPLTSPAFYRVGIR